MLGIVMIAALNATGGSVKNDLRHTFDILSL